MKLQKWLIVLLTALLMFSFSSDKSGAIGNISFPLGNVLVYAKGETRAKKATFKMPIFTGDKVETKRSSRCELSFNDGSVVRIAEQSVYTVEKARITEKSKEVEASLSFGKIWANVKKLFTSNDEWTLRSPAAVVAVRGTIYRMNANPDSSADVLVYEGNVAVSKPVPVSGPGMGQAPGKPHQVAPPTQVQGPTQVSKEQWIEIIKAQQQIRIAPDGTYKKSEFDLVADAQSDWVKWNLERDKLIDRR